MATKERSVKMHGNPMNLIGNTVKIGDKAPDFIVLNNDLKPFSLSDCKGKTCMISAVPSLDTPVCDAETRRFNIEAGKLKEDIRILTISMDLPFAQKRWCGAAGVDKVMTLSDHRDASFGMAYGILIKDLRLLARVVYIIDKEGVIRYIQVVDEVTHEPDYEHIRKALAQLS